MNDLIKELKRPGATSLEIIAADRIESLTARVAELEDFCIWMTGAHDFAQYSYFCEQRDRLFKDLIPPPPPPETSE